MNRLIVTRADSVIQKMIDLTHPLLKKYATKCGAEFLVLNQNTRLHNHWRILKCKELLKEFDRILMIDTDVLITKTCPIIFDVVPYDKIGTIFEDKGSRLEPRRKVMREVQRRYGDVGWREGYMNSGVCVISKIHEKIFEPIKETYWQGWGLDDVHFRYNSVKYGYKIYELPFQYNHMSMFSEPWNNSAPRFASHIIHYAGYGAFPDKGSLSRLELMKKDYNEHKEMFL